MPGQIVESPNPGEFLFGKVVALQRTADSHPRVLRNSIQVSVRQQPLGQRREGDESGSGFGRQRQHPRGLGPAVEDVVAVLEEQARHVALGQIAEGEAGRFERIARDADIEGLAAANDVDQRLKRLLQRRHGIEPVGIEDVDIVEFRSPERLVKTGHEVLARPPVSVGPRPHVVAGLRGDEEFVAVRPEGVVHQASEVLLGRSVIGAVVVGQVEVDDPVVEGTAGHAADVREGLQAAEVVPQSEREGRQQDTALPGAAVRHPAFVTQRSGLIGGLNHTIVFYGWKLTRN